MPSQTEKVNRYYEATVFDYHSLWTSRADLAIHFGYYDRATTSHSRSLLRMNEILAQKGAITKHSRVLDAGCGYGGSSLWLAKNIGCNVVGLNIVPFQIAKARREAHRRGVAQRVTFLQEDFTHTSLPSESFDVVWGLESIVHAENKVAFINEAYRLLKKGGCMIIAEYTLRDEPALSEKEFAELRVWLEGWAMPNLLEATRYKKLLEQTGFDLITIENITPQVLPSLKRLQFFLQFGLPIGRLFKKIKLFSLEHLGNIEGSRVQIETLKKGYWQYSVIRAYK